MIDSELDDPCEHDIYVSKRVSMFIKTTNRYENVELIRCKKCDFYKEKSYFSSVPEYEKIYKHPLSIIEYDY